MSAGIKKMLAERAARQCTMSAGSNRFREGIERIRAAAAILDDGFDSATEWAPSELLIIGYCALATSARPEGAEELLRDRLAALSASRMSEDAK
jgi:hypothetical protein